MFDIPAIHVKKNPVITVINFSHKCQKYLPTYIRYIKYSFQYLKQKLRQRAAYIAFSLVIIIIGSTFRVSDLKVISNIDNIASPPDAAVPPPNLLFAGTVILR